MSQITGVGFSNFRVFKNPTYFNLAPISIFTGTNSCGKSSVFKGLKLLNNNTDDLTSLNFSGEGHKLGTFNLAKTRYSSSNTMRFVLELDHNFLLIIDYIPSPTGNKEDGYLKQFFVTIGTECKQSYKDEELLLRASYIENEPELETFINLKYLVQNLKEKTERFDNMEESTIKEYMKEYVAKLEEWNFKIISIDKIAKQIPSLNLKEVEILAYELGNILLNKLSIRFIDPMSSNLFKPVAKTMFQIIEDIKFPSHINSISCKDLLADTGIDPSTLYQLNDITILEILDKNFIEIIQEHSEIRLRSISNAIKQATKEIHYLEAIRANSQRLYSNQSQGTYFNTQLLELEHVWGSEKKRIKGVSFADKWLKLFGIGDQVVVKRIKGIATEVTIKREGAEVDLIDLGYGATQLLPIILYICSKADMKADYSTFSWDEEDANSMPFDNEVINRKNGQLILIEEPEANLHPKLQSLLADFFVDVAKNFEVTLLLETHSEYLIRRLQVLTAAKEVNPEDSVIYYLNGDKVKTEQGMVTTININPDGSLTNDFGPGFIDEATNWKLELMRLKNAHLYNVN